MRPLLSLKTLLRAPFKTLLTFLLIAAASFMAFSRVADYSVTQREMQRATSYYRGVAALDNGTPNTALYLGSKLPGFTQYDKNEDTPPEGLAKEEISALAALPGVSSTDIRYMTAGVSDDLKRVINYGPYTVKYDYTDRFIAEGTLTDISTGDWGGSNVNILKLSDCRQYAGGLPIAQGGDISVIGFALDGSNNFLSRDMHVFFGIFNNPFGQSFVDGLSIGERYLVIGRWDPNCFIDSERGNMMNAFIGDQDTINYCDSFWMLKDKPENYLETGEFADVRQIIDITNRDKKTFDIVYTSDMLSIPRFNERKMVIQEGRALNDADTNACVVNYSMMELNGLKVGDKITMELCDKLLPQNSGMGATAVIPERYGNPVGTVELEIVGAYADADAQYERDGMEWWCYSPNTIFVPGSLLPVEPPADYPVRPGEFSAVIGDAYQMEAFLSEANPLVKEMGLSLRFSDGGWLEVKDSVAASLKASLLTAALYLGAAAIALLLAVYLYIGREAKSYAIMRALGAPRKKARSALALPLAALSALAIPAGGIAGMVYAGKSISAALQNMAVAAGQYTPDASLPAAAMVLCLLCEAVFLTALSALFLRKLAKTPPLTLLQGGSAHAKKRAVQLVQSEDEPIPEFELSFPVGSDMPERNGYGAARHATRYMLRHMRRAGWKTVLALLLAFLLTGAIGLLAITRLSYRELFDNTQVTGTLSNYSSGAVMEASKSALMKDFYYSGGFSVICNDIPSISGTLLAFTNDIDRYVQSKSTDEYAIEYAEGCDSSLFSGNEPQCLVGCYTAEKYGVRPGDSIKLLSWERHYILSAMYEDKAEFLSQIKQAGLEFQVAGIITSEDPHIGIGLFAPLGEAAESISEYIEYPFPVELGQFTLVDKEDPYGLRDYLDELKRYDSKYMEAISYNLDTTELDNIRRVRDMLRLLFPIAAAAAVLIGLAATGLIIMQSAKEAAILRILGTTKLRARCMLAFEQVSLCVFGLMLAAAGLAAYNAELFARSAGILALCGALYVSGCACAAILSAASVTRHKALELLQVKE